MSAKAPAPRRRWRSSVGCARIVAVLLTGALLPACSGGRSSLPATTTTSTTSLPQPAGTRVLTFEPFSVQGTVLSTLRVTATVSGHCLTGGVAGNSSYRCFAGNDIYDPCFARPGASNGPLLCTSNPARSEVVQLDVGTLPEPLGGVPEERSWAIQLSNGQICVLVDAAWGGLGPFGCQPAPPATLADCHVPEKASPWWTAGCQDQASDSSPFSSYRVTTVWS